MHGTAAHHDLSWDVPAAKGEFANIALRGGDAARALGRITRKMEGVQRKGHVRAHRYRVSQGHCVDLYVFTERGIVGCVELSASSWYQVKVIPLTFAEVHGNDPWPSICQTAQSRKP
jgi:hypothetical protein